MTKRLIYKLIRDYRTYLENNGIPVSQVVLFGSQVKGTTHKGSDIDVCIVSPIFGHDHHNERVMLMNHGLNVSTLIEPHPYSPGELEDPYDPLANEIRQTGVVI